MNQRDLLDRYAELLCEVGVHLEPGQDLAVNAFIEHAPLARAVAEHAYERGAHYVDIWYWDPHAKRSRIRHAPEDTLSWTPPWLDARYEQLARRRGALVIIAGDPNPSLLAGLDERRAGLDRMPGLASRYRVQSLQQIAWTIGCCATEGWATSLFGEPDLDRLWELLARLLRLDQPDPAEAWRRHLARLRARAALLNSRQFEQVRFTGPGTDLTLGLIPAALWKMAEDTGPRGHPNVFNMPTEETFTTPHWGRASGSVTTTLPLALAGALIERFSLKVEDGVIVDVDADRGADLILAHMTVDPGARRFGEVSIVDETSPIAQSGVVFRETLLDENATCHIAWGNGIRSVLPGWREMSDDQLHAAGVNQSATHVDFMVGGPQVSVTGITSNGTEIPILTRGRWQLGES
jgi:aminopeptidase